MQTRTSVSDPLIIDAVSAGDTGGLIGITFCPGKRDGSLRGARWERDLDVDLDVVALWAPAAVVTLIEAHEFRLLGVTDLAARIQARGLEWHHLPIGDLEAPGQSFERGWKDSGPRLLNYLRCGKRVVVHCRGGLGRAGTVAALMLAELGVPGPEGIARVRRARPGAIETKVQADYVLDRDKGAGRQCTT